MFPVFTLSCIQDKLLVGGGGGSTKAGVRNTLKFYNTESEIIKFFEQDAVMAATYHPFEKVIVAGVGNTVQFYKVNLEFEYLNSIEIDIKSEYEFIKKLVFNFDGSLLLILVSDGSWLMYEWPSYLLLHSEISTVENYDASFINDSSDLMIVTLGT